MATFYERPERGWTPIPNELLHTTELKPIARLVLMHALSNRADWEEPARVIAEKLGVNRDTVTDALNQLVKYGYARPTRRIVQPRRPPVKGWDFAWPAFPDEGSTCSEPKRSSSATGKSGYGELPLRKNSVAEEDRSGSSPLRKNSAPLLDDLSTKTPRQNKQDEKTLTPAHPTEEAPRVLRNFNGYQPPAEPAQEPTTPTKPRKARSKSTDDPDFDRAWELYDYKPEKVAARRAWAKALKAATAEEILAAIPAYVAQAPKPGEPEGRGATWRPRRKNFSTWLNKECWRDEIEPPKKGYQGQAGSDARPRHEYEDDTKHLPVPALMRKSPFILNRQGCYAWYWYWNRDQADWGQDQLIAFGNTPDDAQVLHEAFRTGPHEGWADLLATVNIEMDRP